MAEEKQKQPKIWNIEEIISMGSNLIGDTISHMRDVKPDERDGTFAKSLAGFMRAACEVAKDQREAAAFLAAKKLDANDINAILIEHLRTLPSDELLALFATVQAPKESQAHA